MKEREVFENEVDVVARQMKRGEHFNLQYEIIWSALNYALDADIRDTLDKTKDRKHTLNQILDYACADWDV